MPSNYIYGTVANYSPRGSSELSERSRKICGQLKAGRQEQIDIVVKKLTDERARLLDEFLSPYVTLVPVPRSAPLVDGALWPTLVIATALAKVGYGKEVLPLVERVTAVARSSTSRPENRPLVHEHRQSMRVLSELISPKEITIVDDVLTQGRTSVACAGLLSEEFPSATIRIFAMMRTQGLQENITRLFDPEVGIITEYPSGKTFREP